MPEFAVAAYRIGHTFLGNDLSINNSNVVNRSTTEDGSRAGESSTGVGDDLIWDIVDSNTAELAASDVPQGNILIIDENGSNNLAEDTFVFDFEAENRAVGNETSEDLPIDEFAVPDPDLQPSAIGGEGKDILQGGEGEDVFNDAPSLDEKYSDRTEADVSDTSFEFIVQAGDGHLDPLPDPPPLIFGPTDECRVTGDEDDYDIEIPGTLFTSDYHIDASWELDFFG